MQQPKQKQPKAKRSTKKPDAILNFFVDIITAIYGMEKLLKIKIVGKTRPGEVLLNHCKATTKNKTSLTNAAAALSKERLQRSK